MVKTLESRKIYILEVQENNLCQLKRSSGKTRKQSIAEVYFYYFFWSIFIFLLKSIFFSNWKFWEMAQAYVVGNKRCTRKVHHEKAKHNFSENCFKDAKQVLRCIHQTWWWEEIPCPQTRPCQAKWFFYQALQIWHSSLQPQVSALQAWESYFLWILSHSSLDLWGELSLQCSSSLHSSKLCHIMCYLWELYVNILLQGEIKSDLAMEERLQVLEEADYLGCLKLVDILTNEFRKKVTKKNCALVEEFCDQFNLNELRTWCQAVRKRTSIGRKWRQWMSSQSFLHFITFYH